MDEKLVIERIHVLSAALEMTNSESPIPNHFTVGERIMIHQERGYWLNQFGSATIREYYVSVEIEEKINNILK